MEKFIYGKLSGDATLVSLIGGARIYSETAPQDTVEPYVVFQFVSGDDVKNCSQDMLMLDAYYMVKAIDKGGTIARCAPIADRIFSLLHKSSGVVAGGITVDTCVREKHLSYAELGEGGIQYRHHGAEYRLNAHRS